MERYKILEELGDGTCGSVYKAINMETCEIVAVKKMKRKFYSWEECVNLREVKSLRKLNHPNIIKLKEIVRENNELFFIFDYMEYNLYQIMRGKQKPFSEEEIRAFMSQVLQGLAYMHKNGYFHRDLKPGTAHRKSCYNPQHTLLPLIMPANVSDIIPNASLEAIDLIKQLCSWDPLRRPTADQSLQHPFFHVGTRIPHPIWDPLQLKLSSVGPTPNLELKLWDFGTQPDDCFLGLTLAVKPSVSNLGFWSLLSPDHNGITPPVESPLSLSFSPIPHSSIGAPQSTGFTIASLQPNILDRPLLAMSSPFQHGHCL
ncbi:hypothetical protein HYC85_031527 [Camellia sinensis]|uniref:Protein kinase domain-containing protein n=1 Tax=Camellia sinensis TaxID=4442 RepID=A0A7J7FUP9_CAMSI|nr:hypothetical protein HYC85_031527 [Camellia sinensis]